MMLRNLKEKDAPLMLEWMHDEDVVHFLKADFAHKTISDCNHFINSASDHTENFHMAVVDEQDTYMGTVSLKNIHDGSAEFAIIMRKIAMGRGFAAEAMKGIIAKGFDELKLQSVYWCVSPDNKRAVRFYDKNGYSRVDPSALDIPNRGGYNAEEISYYIWYKMESEHN